MKIIKLILTLGAIFISASLHAAVYSVTVNTVGASSGGDDGLSSGSGTGTYDTDTGQIQLNFTTTTQSSIHHFLTTTEAGYTGLTGSYQTLSCIDLGSTYDICGTDFEGDQYVPLNTWSAITVLTNTVDLSGNGVITTTLTNKYGTTVNSELTITTVPIPAAAWLFGSALIGLAGIKRKK